MTNSLLWTPLAFGLIGLALPKRWTGWWATLGALVTLGISISLVAGFDSGASGLQDTVDVSWISGLGVDYSLGIDGLNVFLILLTTVLWTAATAFAAFREQERPHLFFLMMLLGETATLGSFLSQDLLLFVVFFDLMLVPFYFLFGVWGTDREDGGPTASAATLKMIVYTLIGSLLMLVGAIATAIIAASHGDHHLTFSIAELSRHPLGEGSQRWIFWFFAAAFLVKMPAFLLHGWMPDAYRAAPLPALAVFSGVLAKVGAYGFLRVVLPLFPSATVQFQTVVLLIALASILYGSVMAFTQTNVRLIAGYSSVAQLGFITAGIFALRADGADGAVLQMVNHGLVVAPLFVIVAILLERSGTEDIREMGGIAMKAPILAALFLIVTLATLAMPGSANFVGEFYILNGLFDAKIVFAIVAISGVAMSAYYALRLYQRTMHNRLPSQQNPGILSREISLRDGVVLVPLVLCILGLALYPQLILKRTDSSVQGTISQVCGPVTSIASFEPPDSGKGGEDGCPGGNDTRTREITQLRPVATGSLEFAGGQPEGRGEQ
jgi:NADH-quinone oxidoreductase subunit M